MEVFFKSKGPFVISFSGTRGDGVSYFSTSKAWPRINANKHESPELELKLSGFATIRVHSRLNYFDKSFPTE
ncbi:MAG: hypothetical protein ACRD72_13585, partial [Candidatus Angelobacter sp.]